MAGIGNFQKEKRIKVEPEKNFSEFFRPIIGCQNIADFMRIDLFHYRHWFSRDMQALGFAWKKGKKVVTTPYLINVYFVVRAQSCINNNVRSYRDIINRRFNNGK